VTNHNRTDLADLLAVITAVARRLELAEDDHSVARARRLRASAIRPLEGRVNAPASTPPDATRPVDSAVLFDLACRATRLRVDYVDDLALVEAASALQDVAIEAAADTTEAASRLAELGRLQAVVPASIRLAPNGPYLVTKPHGLTDHLGVSTATRPQMALCRCGKSENKPLCDGTHAKVGFTDEKDPHRVTDQRESYEGVRVTVLDNRGICAHSGFCTDRLSRVFHAGDDPFVSPSGAREDDIVRAVRACPSGALSYALHNVEQREDIDPPRPQNIEVSKDGPYRVTGGAPLLDTYGQPVARNDGVSLEHFSLCRCGRSQNKPFCSGMHYYVDFRDPAPVTGREPTLFEWAGGFPALLAMTRTFYEKYVPEEPLLAPFFSHMAPDHPERVAAWLAETFGGPTAYTQDYGGYDRMLSQHLDKAITEEQRARWVQLLMRAANDVGLPDDAEFRAAFTAYVEWGSHLARENSAPGAKPPLHMPTPRWWWVCDATPDARVSALAGISNVEPDAPVVLPEPGEAVSFDRHIKTLFRSFDRKSMSFAFDLWSYDDVVAQAGAILARLCDGTMPCDGAWPAERIAVFERWIATGCGT
jgi:CDGSH-type Zn-finger protein/truncated hemoglobin YjbI